MLEKNLKSIQDKVKDACKRSGRHPEDVTLIAVSKTKPVSMLQEIYDLGIRQFGENKVQELTDKYEKLPKDISWHMIGHLQRNKVKYLIGKTTLIHSVDSLRLAEAIEAEAAKKNCLVDVLIEVNVAGEESKFGISPEEVLPLVEQIARFRHIKIKGLMTIAPFVEIQKKIVYILQNLRKLSVDIAKEKVDNVNMSILSMGMTNDLKLL